MISGQGIDSLHPAKRRMFLDKTQLFSTILLPFNAKMWRKMTKNTHHWYCLPKSFSAFFGPFREQRIATHLFFLTFHPCEFIDFDKENMSDCFLTI